MTDSAAYTIMIYKLILYLHDMGLADQWNNHVDRIVEIADRLGNSIMLRRFFCVLGLTATLERGASLCKTGQDLNKENGKMKLM